MVSSLPMFCLTFIISSTLFQLSVIVQGNSSVGKFVPQLKKILGKCPDIVPPKTVLQTSEIEGTFYLVSTSLNEDQAKAMTCGIRIVHVDKEGHLHNEVTVTENGQQKYTEFIWKPIADKPNCFSTQPNEDTTMTASLFFPNNNTCVFYYVTCSMDNSHHSYGLFIGVRDLKKFSAEEVEIVAADFKKEHGDEFEVYPTTHDASCIYPELHTHSHE